MTARRKVKMFAKDGASFRVKHLPLDPRVQKRSMSRCRQLGRTGWICEICRK